MGRQQFEMIVASVPRESTVFTGIDKTVSIDVNGAELIDVYSPPNTISNIVDMRIECPAVPNATTGDQHLYLRYAYPFIYSIDGRANFGRNLTWSYGSWYEADKSQLPSTVDAQVSAAKNIFFDDLTPLTIVYENLTDKVQTNARKYYLVTKQRQKA
jgi:hypothetical protein